MSTVRKVAILVFDGVEVLDFAGPFEVFSVASRVAVRDGDSGVAPFDVYVCSHAARTVRARHGLVITSDHTLPNAPQPDILIVPGGIIADVMRTSELIDWIAESQLHAEVMASVCTGAFLLGRAGLLTGRRATTHWEDIADLRRECPETIVLDHVRYVDEGRVVTSAGVSAGIEMSLHLVSRLTTPDLASRTARQIEYTFER